MIEDLNVQVTQNKIKINIIWVEDGVSLGGRIAISSSHIDWLIQALSASLEWQNSEQISDDEYIKVSCIGHEMNPTVSVAYSQKCETEAVIILSEERVEELISELRKLKEL
ncbi:MAG: hypothetical protein INQ03_05675 [Candidatus Heimdallarchaeota archaeon]|nr:hypothetical protein [Candidatus Heimdallarchaeota archaeon]